eukprot:TRINITY_DN22853_c0_g1_i1.p1 TRINITY_DN22853_c0_g1~~TRINITY_DN22853_c0_g1_i1.p1  ORF type:complete len:141 (-),score=22.31 TRINITY_DN22853_c0_g1_i1:44-466(-)
MAFTVQSRQGAANGSSEVSIGAMAGFSVGQAGSLYSRGFDECCCVIAHNGSTGAFIHVEPWQQANNRKIRNLDADKGNSTFEEMWKRVPAGDQKVILIYHREPNQPLIDQANREGWQKHQVSAGRFSVEFDGNNSIKIGE